VRRTLPFVALMAMVACPGNDDDSAQIDQEGIFDGDDDDAGGDPVIPPAGFGVECSEVEPNDPPVPPGTLTLLAPPWEMATDCGDVAPAAEGLVRFRGRISDIIEGGWDGDRDAFRFRLLEAATPRGVLQWDPLQGDLDGQIRCALDGAEPARIFLSGLASAEVPETATAEEEVPAGSVCWVFVSGFAGRVADYELWLE
jgi:hypothetical protein